MESESSASVAKRRARFLRQFSAEFILASAFVAAVFFGVKLVDGNSPNYLRGLAALLPVIVLTLWWCFYSVHIMRLEEFYQTIAIRSIAIACAATLWLTTAYGFMALYMNVPEMPLVMVAPLTTSVYAIIRGAFTLKYR